MLHTSGCMAKMASDNPLSTLERMLNGKTTLKTQKVSHKSIVCIGTELLNEVQKIMKEDREKAVHDAVAEAQAKALEDKNETLRELTFRLNEEREQLLEEERLRAKEQMAEIRYRCEVAEKKRARLAHERYQQEKAEALKEAGRNAEKEKEESLQELTVNLTKILRNKAAFEKELAVAEALAVAKRKAEEHLQQSIDDTRKACTAKAKEEAARVASIHQKEANELQQRLGYITKILEMERNAKTTLESTFYDMKEDYKRFQDYTHGFHSDFLMK